MPGNDAFITGLDDDGLDPLVFREKTKDERLSQVRKDHGKLMDVVKTFGNKVGGMIDKQRYEFMSAYEHHIQDIQDELQNLREKVAIISGEETRKAKLETLDKSQTQFKTEALSLDQDVMAQRKKLRKLVNSLHSVERDRDWTFKRLKQAKERYLELVSMKDNTQVMNFEETQRSNKSEIRDITHDTGAWDWSDGNNGHKVGDTYDAGSVGGGSVGSLESHESDISIHVGSGRLANKDRRTNAEVKAEIRQVYGVHREQALLSTLPHILPVSAAAANQKAATANAMMLSQQQQQQYQQQPQHQFNASQSESSLGGYTEAKGDNGNGSPTKAVRKSKEERDAVGELVALRMKQEEIRDFVAQCASSCDKGPWARLPNRPINELLDACSEINADMEAHATEEGTSWDGENQGPDHREQDRLLLAMELSAIPEVYYIISDMLAGHDSMQQEQMKERYAQWSAQAVSMSSQTNYADEDGGEEFAIDTPMDMRVKTGLSEQGQGQGNNALPETLLAGEDFLPSEVYEGDEEDKGGVQISSWYDPSDIDSRSNTAGSNNNAPRQGTSLSSYGVSQGGERSGSLTSAVGGMRKSHSGVEGDSVDLLGGADIIDYLKKAAADRAYPEEEASLAAETSDWMNFD